MDSDREIENDAEKDDSVVEEVRMEVAVSDQGDHQEASKSYNTVVNSNQSSASVLPCASSNESTLWTTRRRMKKNDSGVSFEDGSFGNDGSDIDIGEERGTDNDNQASGGVKMHRSKVKKTEDSSDKNSPDSGHQGESAEMEFFGTESERDDDLSAVSSDSLKVSESVGRSGAEAAGETRGNQYPKEDEEEENSSSSNSSDEDGDDLPRKRKPRHNWCVCPELFKRQYGVGNNFSNDLFRLKAYGSLHMVERLELMYKMKRHTGCVNALHFNSSGTRLVSGSDDLLVVIWDWTIGENVLVYESGHRSNVFQVKFMPLGNDCHIVSCARDGQVRLAELSTTGVCKETRRLAAHRGPAHKISLEPFSPHTFLSCGEDAVVFKIDLRENKPIKMLNCRENDRRVPLYSVHANPSNEYEFAIGGKDHFVRIYDMRKVREDDSQLKKYCPHHLLNSDIRANITCLLYNYDGSEILVSYNDEDIYTFDTSHSDGAEYVRQYCGHRNSATVKGVNYFGPKSEFIVSGSDCGNIYLWEHDSEAVVQFMPGDEGGVVNCLEPHPHSPILATSGLDDDIKIWVPSCEKPPKLKGLRSVMKTNRREREEERRQEPDTIDGQMLWFLMHHLRRNARRSAREDGQSAEASTGDDDSSDSDGSDASPHPVQCSPS
ncbi:DDB1- and CUL4-associated factor 8 [Chamberlinius hualienensis]